MESICQGLLKSPSRAVFPILSQQAKRLQTKGPGGCQMAILQKDPSLASKDLFSLWKTNKFQNLWVSLLVNPCCFFQALGSNPLKNN